jgi:hypothetical protein
MSVIMTACHRQYICVVQRTRQAHVVAVLYPTSFCALHSCIYGTKQLLICHLKLVASGGEGEDKQAASGQPIIQCSDLEHSH